MDADILTYLREGRISTRRLGDMGLGAVGITLNPHFILDRAGHPTRWLAKRLRSSQFSDPAAAFSRFEDEHHMIERYFGISKPSLVAESEFVVLDRPLDDHADHRGGRDYVMVQEYVEGVTLDRAAARFRVGDLPWLGEAVHRFVAAYRRMQREAGATLDCFSTRSDHVKVDVDGRRLLLIDTNNPVMLRQELENNAAFLSRFRGNLAAVTAEDLHVVFDAMCRSGEYDPDLLVTTRDASFLRDARGVELTARYFPRSGQDNFYVRQVLDSFFPPGLSSPA